MITAMLVDRTLDQAQAQRARFLRELITFVRSPSVSAQPQHAGDLHACAEWLAAHLRQIGMGQVTVAPTARHPVVCAEWRRTLATA